MRVITWRAWPLRKSPGRGALAAVVVAGCIWGTWSWTLDPWLTAMAAAVLGIAVAPFFVPTRYELSEQGVEVARPWRRRRRSWRDFRRVSGARGMLLLSPFERSTWLDSIRGETLLLEDNENEVLEYAEAMVGSGNR